MWLFPKHIFLLIFELCLNLPYLCEESYVTKLVILGTVRGHLLVRAALSLRAGPRCTLGAAPHADLLCGNCSHGRVSCQHSLTADN